jgi:hypothetical protein
MVTHCEIEKIQYKRIAARDLSMQTASARYGWPKGTGLDDRERLESIAATLVADPKLKPTTAIRAPGIDDPSTIRRLRDKFNFENGNLMAEARRAARAKTSGTQREVAKLAQVAQSTIETAIEPVIKFVAIADALPGPKSSPLPSLSIVPQSSLLVGCFDMGVCALSTAVQGQSILADYWLSLPAASMAMRGQLTLNAVAIAMYTRSKGRKACLN